MSEELTDDLRALLAKADSGSEVASYLLKSRIGTGSLAVVFLARDLRIPQLEVAVKVMIPALRSDKAFREQFIRASQAATSIGHPHIIPIYAVGEARGVLFIAMAHAADGDVRGQLRTGGPMTAARVVAIISPVATALDAAHAAGLVHGNVKPTNMLLDIRPDQPELVYLSDFGHCQDSLSDGMADQYALVCSAVEMLTGDITPEGGGWVSPRISLLRPELAAADPVFAKALAKEPSDRYATCVEFADALRDAVSHDDHPLARGHPSAVVGAEPPDDEVNVVYLSDPWTALLQSGQLRRIRPADQPESADSAGLAARARRRVQTASGYRRFLADQSGTERRVRFPRLKWSARRTASAAVSAMLGAAVATAVAMVAAATLMPIPDRPPGQPTASPGRTLTGQGAITSAVFSQSGSALAVTSGVNDGYLWNLSSGRADAGFTVPARTAPYSSALTAKGLLATGNNNGATKLWDLHLGLLIKTIYDENGGARYLAFSPNGQILAIGATGGYVDLYNIATGRFVPDLVYPPYVAPQALAFSPDGRMLAASVGSTTYLWPNATGLHDDRVALRDPDKMPVRSVAFGPDEGILAAADTAGNVYLWKVASGQLLGALAFGYESGTIRESGGRSSLDSGTAQADSVAFSRAGGLLAVGESSGETYLWSIKYQRLAGTFGIAGDPAVDVVAFSTGSRLLAVGCVNGNVALWHVGQLMSPSSNRRGT